MEDDKIIYHGIECRVMSHRTDLPQIVIENVRGTTPFHQKLITQSEYKDCVRGRPLKKPKGEAYRLIDDKGFTHKVAETWILCKKAQQALEKSPSHKLTNFKIL